MTAHTSRKGNDVDSFIGCLKNYIIPIFTAGISLILLAAAFITALSIVNTKGVTSADVIMAASFECLTLLN